jgi:DNA repair photolyase
VSLIKATGNMYPWVTHMHSHLRGACPHACPYCYATKGRAQRFAQGPLTFKADELHVGYGSRDGVPKTIFIEHTHDLFADGVDGQWVSLILSHCRQTPYNQYVFQTRNTARAAKWESSLPAGCMLGTTIETNRKAPGLAPHPKHRAMGLMRELYNETVTRFVTIEPILDFDVPYMLELIEIVRPAFLNIGADSKGCGLEEPSADKVLDLIHGINAMGIEIRQKTNLERLLKGGAE